MPNFTESLTIRILGDSSHLQQELQDVTRYVTDLRTQFARLAEVNRAIDQSLSRISALSQPLQTISRSIDRIIQQVRNLSRTPVTLNVAPALNSVAVLSAAISRLTAQVRAIPPVTPHVSVPRPNIVPPRVPSRRFATGGLVNGPAGTDRVPALLTAGEFVIREPAARQLGTTFLEALNQNRQPAPRPSVAPAAIEQSTVNNFGGIAINVRTPTEVNNIIRDLRLQGIQLRNRRG